MGSELPWLDLVPPADIWDMGMSCRGVGVGTAQIFAALEMMLREAHGVYAWLSFPRGGTHKTPAAQALLSPRCPRDTGRWQGVLVTPRSQLLSGRICNGVWGGSAGHPWAEITSVCARWVTSPCTLLAGSGVGRAGRRPSTQPQELYVLFFYSPPPPALLGWLLAVPTPAPGFLS